MLFLPVFLIYQFLRIKIRYYIFDVIFLMLCLKKYIAIILLIYLLSIYVECKTCHQDKARNSEPVRSQRAQCINLFWILNEFVNQSYISHVYSAYYFLERHTKEEKKSCKNWHFDNVRNTEKIRKKFRQCTVFACIFVEFFN